MADLPVLDPVEQRILGSLLEKQRTVPATYPMTLNALRTACNQTSSREPVTDYDEPLITETLRRLKQRGLVRVVWADTGRRTLKYHQTLDEVLDLPPDERALLTVLLLRGPQAPGELRTRSERLHAFADRREVEECLRRMAGASPPLVQQLELRAGQQDNRWAHLLGAVPVETPADTELGEAATTRDDRVVATYDAVAAAYADRFVHEYDAGERPFDAWLLRRVAEASAGGPLVEVGCGPGHATAFLAAAGADARGLDLSPGMVAEARRRFPDLDFEVGDLTRLMRPPAGEGWAAVVSWYSLIHFAGSELPAAVAALARPLRPGGRLAIGLHAGGTVRHLDSWFDHDVDLDFVLHDPDRVRAAVEAAGLTVREWYLRGPQDDETTHRFYVLAQRPDPV